MYKYIITYKHKKTNVVFADVSKPVANKQTAIDGFNEFNSFNSFKLLSCKKIK
mgnify:CR=1 FL=1